MRNRRKDGQDIDEETDDRDLSFDVKTIKITWETSSNSYIHIFVNTTMTKNFEKEKATNKCLNIMFSSVSHEFRTPINAFINAVELLEMNFGRINQIVLPQNALKYEPIDKNKEDKSILQNEKSLDILQTSTKKYIKIGKVSAKLLLGLTEDILDLAKMEAGMFTLNINDFVINDIIEDITYIFEDQ